MADLKVVSPFRDLIAETCVERLEQGVDLARSQPLAGVAIFYLYRDGGYGSSYCVTDDAQAVGGLEIVKARIMRDASE